MDYSDYLQLDELLNLQRPLSEGPDHDETLFIVVHQVYELWFKEILHELDYLQARLDRGDTPRALHTLKRILTILKVLVSQLDVLETMTPLQFSSFRDRLATSSGIQSLQFRQIEFALGLKSAEALERMAPGSRERQILQMRYDGPTLWDAFLRYLQGAKYAVPREALERDLTQAPAACPALQKVLVELYRTDPATTQLCERFVDLDEGLQEWRYRHVKMVERTIGTKHGTGGSSGAQYLRATLFRPVFPDLWAIREQL